MGTARGLAAGPDVEGSDGMAAAQGNVTGIEVSTTEAWCASDGDRAARFAAGVEV